MLKELEQHQPAFFRGLIKCVQLHLARQAMLDLPEEEAKAKAKQCGYNTIENLKRSVEYHKGMALGYATAAWTLLNQRPPKDVFEENEIYDALSKIKKDLEPSHVS